MNKSINIILGIFVLIGIIVLSGAVYTVDETQLAVVTQFGKPVGKPITQAGLYFKMPVVQTVNYFDKRILQWDGDPNQIPTLDKRYIWVDTTARWRIMDALKFMQSVGTETSAQARLDDILDSATRDAVSSLILVEAIRNSNRLIEEAERQKKDSGKRGFELSDVVREKIKVGREELTRDILRRSSESVPSYGIEMVDVRIKRINYVKEVQRKVFERMISERKRAAEQYRSEGQGNKAEIEGQMTKELKEIRSQAYKAAQKIKGEADAKAIKIYADAYNKDSEFYSFTKTLETYRRTVNKDTTLILSTDNDFYRYLKGINKKDLP